MPVIGMTVGEAEASAKAAILIGRLRRGREIIAARPDLVILEGDTITVAAQRDLLVDLLTNRATEVDDRELLDIPVESGDVFVTNKLVAGKTLAELATRPAAHGVFLRKITRNMIELPILPGTEIHRGDILTLVGSPTAVDAVAKDLGYLDRPVEDTDIAFVGLGILMGGLVGALSYKAGGIPISL